MLDKFFNKISYWLVFLIGWFTTGLITFLMFYFLSVDNKPFQFILCLKIGACAGVLFGLMWTLMVSMMRQSKKFWDYAEHVEGLINLAATKEELKSIENEEWKKLMSMGSGQPHYMELQKLWAVMKTKYAFLP